MNFKDVMQKILDAGFKMNPYAQTYFHAFPKAEILGGERGVKTQILYFFSNQRARGDIQKAVKKELMRYANS